ncbi:MAG: hypothetical protein HYZ11_15125 [Candidatus Tectomicrobia bacterium]|uniref:Flagellin n=1 Tax=Tectimicrobiota bacterium TaxID=2528274 RepID=A0A932MRC7_UNCTE|nr:hypothetical protein [Candidatus Tectomicrobia bacterium]
MGLRINQNIAALNAARNLRITDGSMSKSLERLSSGFRINRAADDPAGLIISENLRAQVAGLGQAIRNSNNAVNLVKTAEAALDELLKQVRSIRTLALDALNTGASDAVARAADQTQIASSVESINRIANTTQFGKIKLLNGSSGVRGSTNDVELQFVKGTTKTVAGTFDVAISQAATKGTQTFTIKNEFETGTANADINLAASEFASFQVEFGASTLTDAERAALGQSLADAGVGDDSTVSGVTVKFDKTTATASVAIDQAAGNFTANAIDSKLTDALNGTKLGKAIEFNEDSADAEKFKLSGLFAGLVFDVRDLTINSSTAGAVGGDGGFTANTNTLQGNAAVAFANTETGTLTIDFAAAFASGTLDSAQSAALGAALAAAGLATQNNLTGTDISDLDVAFTEATATAVITVTANGAVNAADLVAALAGTTVGRFVHFADNAGKLDVIASIGGATVQSGGAAGQFGFNTLATFNAPVDLASTERATLGSAQGLAAADIKVLGETLTVNDSTVVEIASGTALTSVVSLINSSLTAEEIEAKAAFKADTASSDKNELTVTNNEFGSVTTKVKSTKAAALPFHLGIGTSNVSVTGKDVAGTINGVTASGSGQFLTLTSAGDNADGIQVKFTGTATKTGIKVTATQDSLVFQVGANSGQTVKQALDDVRANKLGLKATGLLTTAKSISDIDVTTVDGANDALKLVDDAINQITTLRGNLGAFQANVLESNIASLGVAQENLAAAESSIRDADFADETVQFTRNQILLQAGTAILTQANAIPQAVLQLLR